MSRFRWEFEISVESETALRADDMELPLDEFETFDSAEELVQRLREAGIDKQAIIEHFMSYMTVYVSYMCGDEAMDTVRIQ